MNVRVFLRAWLALLIGAVGSIAAASEDLTRWQPFPSDFRPTVVSADRVSMDRGHAWGYLRSPEEHTDVEVSATVTVEQAATQFDFFGSSWSAWPDPKFEDRGFEAAVMVRSGEDGSRGYRVQWSSKYQEVAVVRFPEGGYLQSVPCPIKTGVEIGVRVTISGNILRVAIDDQEVIRIVDRLEPILNRGRLGIGASSGARVTFSDLAIRSVEAEPPLAPQPYQPRLTARTWLGGRLFIFDGNEPILQLHNEHDPSCFAKLMPGDKPRLTFDSHWGLENQGAFPEAKVSWTAPSVSGGGDHILARWSSTHLSNRFVTRSSLRVGYDDQRGTYTYDIDSELEVLPGDPFHFRYGFDFEHHTPLDPFRWQYLLIRDGEGTLTYRPLSPFDPGTLNDIQSYDGLRVWHGRTGEMHRVSPAVEYRIHPEWIAVEDDKGKKSQRKLNTAVCAAFYDTGVAFEAVTAKAGDKLRVQYRYTGYPSQETSELFATARVQENPRIDPQHHFIFARDQWPTIRFVDSLTMDKPWWGGRPFMSGHNARPAYDFVQDGDQGMLRLGPISYAAAAVGPAKVEPGPYIVTARIKSVNTHGPGGRIELLMLKKSDLDGNSFVRWDRGNIVAEQTRYFGHGSYDWREVSFVADVPKEATGLALGLGNAGTGEVLVAGVRIEPAEQRQASIQALAPTPPPDPLGLDALWDLRMQEKDGPYVYNYGVSTHRALELANVDWVEDSGRSAIRFSENPLDRDDYPLLGILDQYLRNPAQRQNYEPFRHGAFGLGGGPYQQVGPLPGLTLAAWIKPALEMGSSTYGGKGDILGFGARRFILGLEGQSAPYTLSARINVSDRIDSTVTIDADRWYHVAMTCTPAGENWQVELYIDGQQVGAGITKSLPVSATFPDSIVLGAELYYLHGAYYRGLMNEVLVVGRALNADELRSLARRSAP